MKKLLCFLLLSFIFSFNSYSKKNVPIFSDRNTDKYQDEIFSSDDNVIEEENQLIKTGNQREYIIGDTVWLSNAQRRIFNLLTLDKDGNIYTISIYDTLYSFTGLGQLNWKTHVEGSISSLPIIAKSNLIFANRNGKVFSYDLHGQKKWEFQGQNNLSFISSWADSVLILSNASQGLTFIDINGNKLWENLILKTNTYPAIGGDGTVYFGSNDSLVAIDRNGIIKWEKYLSYNSSGKYLSLGKNGEIFVYQNRTLYTLSKDGEILWSYQADGSLNNPPSVAEDGTIFLATGGGYLSVINTDGVLKWKFKAEGTGIYNIPVVGKDGNILFSCSSKFIYLLSPKGELIWKNKTTETLSSPTIGENGVAYFISNSSKILGIYIGCKGLANSSWPKIYQNQFNSGFWLDKYSGELKIEDFPSDTTLCEGVDFHFNIDYKGNRPISITWYHNGKLLKQGIEITLDFKKITKKEEGAYYCTLINSTDTITSDTISLSVYPVPEKPEIQFDPGVLLTKSEPGLTYQWSNRDSMLDGATLSTYSLTQKGSYYVTVTNQFGCSAPSDMVHFYEPSDSICSYAVSINSLYISSNNKGDIYNVSGNRLVAFNRNGDNIWQFKADGNISSISAVNSSGVIHFFTSSFLYALNPDGSLIWCVPANNLTGELAIGKNNVIYAVSPNSLNAFSPDGVKRWTMNFSNSVSISMIDDEGLIYLGVKKIIVVHPDGYVVRNIDMEINDLVISEEGKIYTRYWKTIYSINKDGHINWILDLPESTSSKLITGKDDVIYAATSDSKLYAISREGYVLWKFDFDKYIQYSPTLGADNRLYFKTNAGTLYCVNSDGTLGWKINTNITNSVPVYLLSDKVLYFLTQNQIKLFYSGAVGLANTSCPFFNQNNQNTKFRNDKYTGKLNLISSFNDTVLCTGIEYQKSIDLSGDRPVTVKWFKNNNIIYEGNNLTFSIKSVQESDEGDYHCIVSNKLGADTSNVFRITVNETPEKPHITQEGSTLVSSVEGNLLWYLNDSLLQNEKLKILIPKRQGCYWLTNGNSSGCVSTSDKFNFYSSFQKIWEYTGPPSFYNSGSAVDSNNVIYFYANKQIYSITTDGKIIDRFYFGTDLVVPIIIQGDYLILCTENSIQKLDKKGELIWKTDLTFTLRNKPAVDQQGNIYFSTEKGVMALDQNGKLKWENKSIVYQTSPVIDENGVIYVYHEMNHNLFALDKNGNEMWKINLIPSITSGPSFGINRLIYIPTSTSIITLSPEGEKIWEYYAGTSFSSLVIDEIGTVYGFGSNGYIYSLSFEGNLIWKKEISKTYSSNTSLTLTDSCFYAYNDSYLTRIKRNGELIGTPLSISYQNIINICPDGTVLAFGNGKLIAFGSNSRLSDDSFWPKNFQNPQNTSQKINIGIQIPKILSQSSDTIVCEGEKYYPFVNFVGAVPYTVEWFKDDKKVSSGNKGYLKIDTISDQNNGSYFCVITNNYGSIRSKTFNIQVELTPVIDRIDNKLVVTGASAVKWYLNDTLTDKTDTTIQPWKSGSYSVISTTSNGCISKSKIINVGNTGDILWTKEWKNFYYNSLAISTKDVIYFIADDNLNAYSNGGKLLWSRSLSSNLHITKTTSPIVGKDGTIYFGLSGIFSDGLMALNPDGSTKWWISIGDALVGDMASGVDDNIYIGTYKNKRLLSYSNEGKLNWYYDLGSRMTSAPSVDSDGTIYVPTTGNKLFALNVEGKLLWSYTIDATVLSSAAINTDGTLYFGSGDGFLYALNKDGSLKWKTKIGTECLSPVISNDGTIYVSSRTQCFSVSQTGTINWQYAMTEVNDLFAPLIDEDGLIYIPSADNALCALNSKGEVVFESTVKDLYYITAPAIASDGTLYVTSSKKMCCEYKLRSFITKGKSLADSPWPKKSQGNHNRSLSTAEYHGIVPTIKNEFTDLSFCERDKFKITFRSSGSLPITYSIYKDSELLQSGRDSIFTIDTLSVSDSGEYFCIATNNFGNNTSKKFKITVNSYPVPPVIRQEGNALISSYSQGNHWFLNDEEYLSDGSSIIKPTFSGPFFVTYERDGCISKSNEIDYFYKGQISVSFNFADGDEPENYKVFPSLNKEDILFIPADTRLFCASPYSKIFWEFAAKKYVATSVNGLGGVCYVGHRSPGTTLYAVDSLGKQMWNYNFDGPNGLVPSLSANNTVYMPITTGKVFALNYLGELLWYKEGFDSINGSISINQQGVLYFGSNDKNLHALDQNGNTLWNFTTGAKVNSSPAIDTDGTIYFGGNDNTFYAINPNGTLKWKYQSAGFNFNSPVIDVNGDIYVTTSNNKIVSLSNGGHLNWIRDGGATPTPTIGNDGLIYVTIGNTKFGAINRQGEVVWESWNGKGVNSVTMTSLGYLFYQHQNGRTISSEACPSTGLANSPWPKIYQNSQNTSCKEIVITGNPPIISQKITDISVCLKKPLTLNCQTLVIEDIFVTWYKDGKKLISGNNKPLIFDQISVSDSGKYYCIVKNAFGSDTSNIFTISVIDCSLFPEYTKTVIEIAKTDAPPIIDGIETGSWDFVKPVPIERNFKDESPTVNAYWKALWDDKGIYVLVNVSDDDHYPSWEANGEYLNYDLVQVFMDVNQIKEDGKGPGVYNAKGHYKSVPQFNKEDYGVRFYNQKYDVSTTGGNYAYRLKNDSYVMEFFYPFENFKNSTDEQLNLPKFLQMKNIGFDITITDQDKGITTSRQRKVWMNDGKSGRGEALMNMDSCGIIRLVETVPVCSPSWIVVHYPNQTIISGIVTLNGEMVSSADSVAVYVGEECRGKAAIEFTNNTAFVELPVYGITEETATFHLWNASKCKEYLSTNNFGTKPGYYFGGNSGFVKIIFGNYLLQTLDLKAGMNLKSLTVRTDNRNSEQLFGDFSCDSLQISNFTEEYTNNLPISDELNSLKALIDGEAYFMESGKDCREDIEGIPLNDNYWIDMEEGYNLVGYPLLTSQSVKQGFKKLIDSDILLQVKNLNQSFDPAMPDYLNTLKSLDSGEGYIVSISNEYKGFTLPLSSEKSKFNQFDIENECQWDFVGYKHSTVKYLQLEIADNEYSNNIKIGAFINGECRAIAPLIYYDGKYYATLVINNDEKSKCEIVICSDGNEKLVTDSIEIIPEEITHDTEYLQTGTDIKKLTNYNSITIYPNPVKNLFTINFYPKILIDTRIDVFNSSGQKILNLEIKKNQLGKIDIQTLGWRTGIYLVKISNEKFFTTRKIEIQK